MRATLRTPRSCDGQSGIFFGFIPFWAGWEIVFFDARGIFRALALKKNIGVFLVFFGVFVMISND